MTLSTLIRYAQPNDGGEDGTPSDKWRKDLPLVVLRVRDTHHVPQPYTDRAVALRTENGFQRIHASARSDPFGFSGSPEMDGAAL